MAVTASVAKLHWNYFLALERDMEVVARYIEFAVPNFQVYSIELAHLLFAAASEVDVVSKLLCSELEPSAPRKNNINAYKAVLLRALPDLPCQQRVHPAIRTNIKAMGGMEWSEQSPLVAQLQQC